MENSRVKQYSGPWTERQISHLLRRTLFGVTLKDHNFFKDKSIEECVDVLLSVVPAPQPPMWCTDDPNVPEGTSFVFAPEVKDRADGNILGLKAWWVEGMLTPQNSITDKMVLFWHNHFALEFGKVLDSRYAYQYLNLMRQHAIGNFKKLTREITTTPCMLVYLNGNINNKAAPNENYGRELQELFTVGKGPDSHYTEADVKAAAKVLSGWKDDEKKIGSYFDPASHDTDDKIFSPFYNNEKIKGINGDGGAKETDDLIAMICGQKEVAKFLCRKLYRWFVNCNIDEKVEKDVIGPLSEIMIQSDYEIKPVLKALLSAEFFYDPYLIGGMFKSPVDYLVGLLRIFNINFSEDEIEEKFQHLYGVAVILGVLGQNLGDPPSVAGWPAYYEFPIYDKSWINSENLSFRNKLARLLSYPEESEGHVKFDFFWFADNLPNPANSQAFVSDSWNSLCCMKLDPNKAKYMVDQLESAQKTQNTWAELWAIYKSEPLKKEAKDEIMNRMRKIFDFIFTSPEFQIM
jgi:uncharacterized protein (DUF1800 family)